MNKVLRPGTLRTHGGGYVSVYINLRDGDGYQSFTGVVGPTRGGNAYGGCGQIDMEFAHRNPEDDDKRYNPPTKASEFRFAEGWNEDMWYDLLDVWNAYHMKREPMPTDIVSFLERLPVTDREPAWC